MIKKIFKSAVLVVTTIPLAFLMCSCWLIPTYHHRPHYLYQTDVIFEDYKGDKLFYHNYGYLNVYSNTDPDYNKGKYIEGTNDGNYKKAVANSNYLIVLLQYINKPNTHYLMVFDKSYNVIQTINFGEREFVHDIACTKNYIYVFIEDLGLKKSSLLRYGFNSDSVLVLVDDLGSTKTYQDDDIRIFFIEPVPSRPLYDIFKYDVGRTRLCYFEEWHFKSDKIDLYLSNNGKNLIIVNEGEENVSRTGLSGINSLFFYEKAYLINEQLVFAVYRQSSTRQCAYSSGQLCICSLLESYLYKYDLVSNELSLVKEFEKGTFLIDYDLDGYKYYKDGGLYINDVLFRECENIYPEYVEHLTNEEKMFYYFSYYNGEFYGV